jgi:hypothetical protein
MLEDMVKELVMVPIHGEPTAVRTAIEGLLLLLPEAPSFGIHEVESVTARVAMMNHFGVPWPLTGTIGIDIGLPIAEVHHERVSVVPAGLWDVLDEIQRRALRYYEALVGCGVYPYIVLNTARVFIGKIEVSNF